MKLMWHIVRKDARRLWLPLVLWAVLMTAGHWIEWRAEHVVTDDKMWTARMRLFASVIWLLQFFIGYVLAAAVVMEDPPTGTTAFWLTRPMTGARVLGAKVLGCGVLLVALPALVALPWWLLAGHGAREMSVLMRETLRWQPWIAGLGLAVATFTRGAGQFLFGTLVVQAAIAAVGITWSNGGPKGATGQMHFAGMVAAVGVALAVLALYHTRRRAMAWAIAGASVACALLIEISALP